MLRFARGDVIEERGEVRVHVTPRVVVVVDKVGGGPDDALDGETVEGCDGDSELRRVDQHSVENALVPPVTEYLRFKDRIPI